MLADVPMLAFRSCVQARLDAGARREHLLFELEDLRHAVPEVQQLVVLDVLDCFYGLVREEYRL